MLIRERVELKRAAQRTERELARKAEEERIALVAARGTGPTRIPRGALAIAVAKKKKPGDNYELERQKALARGEEPPAPRAPRYGSLAERAQRGMSAEALAALPKNMPVLPITSPTPALTKSVRWNVKTPEGAK